MYVNTFLIFIFRNFWAVAATYPNGETSLAFKLFDRKLRATRKNGFFYGSLALALDDTPAEKEKGGERKNFSLPLSLLNHEKQK